MFGGAVSGGFSLAHREVCPLLGPPQEEGQAMQRVWNALKGIRSSGQSQMYLVMISGGNQVVLSGEKWHISCIMQLSVKVKVRLLSHVQLFATLWTAAHQAPPSMGFSRQEYWSGVPLPSPGDLPYPGIEPGLPHCRQTLYPLSLQGSPHAAFCTMSLFHVKEVASLCQAPCAGFGMETGLSSHDSLCSTELGLFRSLL